MSYEKCTIKEIIKDIDQNKLYLPALQRKFVWDKHRIQLLFDSLMRNFPFGTFLFWRLHRSKAENYVFYEFLREYDQRSPFPRRKTGAFTHEEIIGVLDGQQRLSSMYIGLMSTHTERLKYAWANNPDNYAKTRLYLNLLSLPYYIDQTNTIAINEEQNFEFRFLTEKWVESNLTRRVEVEDRRSLVTESMYWMPVGQVLSWNNEPEIDQIYEDLLAQCRSDAQVTSFLQQKRLIKRALDVLHSRIFEDELINYFEVTKDDLEDILKIFVRVNSAGTPLSKPDLLFSTIVATWDDGRDQIEDLLKKINALGFNFGHEYLMRCCLVLSDGPAVYKVNSFKAENVEKIRVVWPQIAAAVERTVKLLKDFGFDGSLLPSQNATILLAYYLYKGGDTSDTSRREMRKYLVHALLKGIYSSSQDQVIANLRNAFREEVKTESGETVYRRRFDSFSFDELLTVSLPGSKTLEVNADDLDRFMEHKKGAASFLVLSLLYPQLNLRSVLFHQDHIHPAAGFNRENRQALGLTDEQWQEWLAWRDSVPNLQLMEGRINESKNATPFQQWLAQIPPDEQEKFIHDNYLPVEEDFSFANFASFYHKRKDILRQELIRVLAHTPVRPLEEEIDWGDRDDEIDTTEIPLVIGALE